jgi:hypothetical protein
VSKQFFAGPVHCGMPLNCPLPNERATPGDAQPERRGGRLPTTTSERARWLLRLRPLRSRTHEG